MTILSRFKTLHRVAPYSFFLFSLLTGCYNSTDSNSSPAPEMANYFQPLNIGDTSQWDFVQYEHLTMTSPITTWTGKMRWKVVAIDSTISTRKTTIEEILSGSWVLVAGTPKDSGAVSSDTSYFTISEDSSHKISFNPNHKTKAMTNYGTSVPFERYYPDTTREKFELNLSFVSGVSFYVLRLQLQQNTGMVKYYAGFEAGGLHRWDCTYTLIQ